MKANDFNPHGYCTITNSLSAEIEIHPSGELARLRFIGLRKQVPQRWVKIRGVNKRFIYCRGVRYHLDNFMRY